MDVRLRDKRGQPTSHTRQPLGVNLRVQVSQTNPRVTLGYMTKSTASSSQYLVVLTSKLG